MLFFVRKILMSKQKIFIFFLNIKTYKIIKDHYMYPSLSTTIHKPPQRSNPSTRAKLETLSTKLETLLKKDPVTISEKLFKDDALSKLLRALKMKNKYPDLFETNLEVKIVALIRKIIPQFQSVLQNTSDEKETLTYKLFCQKHLSLYTQDEIAQLKNSFRPFKDQNPNPLETSKNPFNSEELKVLYHFCIIKVLAKKINKQTEIKAAYNLLALSQYPT